MTPLRTGRAYAASTVASRALRVPTGQPYRAALDTTAPATSNTPIEGNTEGRNQLREVSTVSGDCRPTLRAQLGVGPDTAAKLLTCFADNPHRIPTEAAFAKITGTAPLEANSGRTTGRHRLNRGGDRQANNALHTIVLTRLRRCEQTRTYHAKRSTDGLGRLEIMRCLKRYVARNLFKIIKADMDALQHNQQPTQTPTLTT